MRPRSRSCRTDPRCQALVRDDPRRCAVASLVPHRRGRRVLPAPQCIRCAAGLPTPSRPMQAVVRGQGHRGGGGAGWARAAGASVGWRRCRGGPRVRRPPLVPHIGRTVNAGCFQRSTAVAPFVPAARRIREQAEVDGPAPRGRGPAAGRQFRTECHPPPLALASWQRSPPSSWCASSRTGPSTRTRLAAPAS